MKTEIYLQEQITAIKSFYQSGKDELLSDSKQGKQIAFFKLCIEYVKTNPSIEFIESEIKRLENKLEIIMKYKPDKAYLNENPNGNEKHYHDIHLGGKKIKEQINTLKFILE